LKNITWTAHVKTAPTVAKYCKGCERKAFFASSGLFRVNAHQKNLDVWLIYKCQACDTTWNLTVLTRVNPQSIPAETLQGFHNNDPALALRTAADISLIKRNGGEPGRPIVEIKGEAVDCAEQTRIHLTAEQATELKVSAILRERLSLSRSEWSRMLDSGKIKCISGQNLAKCKLAGEIIIEIG